MDLNLIANRAINIRNRWLRISDYCSRNCAGSIDEVGGVESIPRKRSILTIFMNINIKRFLFANRAPDASSESEIVQIANVGVSIGVAGGISDVDMIINSHQLSVIVPSNDAC